MMNEPVHLIMSCNLITASPESSLVDIKTIFSNSNFHHLPIVNKSKLVGIITTHDLWRLGKSFSEYENFKAKDIMTTKLAKLDPFDKIGTAAELFLSNRFHCLPIVDEDSILIGLVTSFDVLRYQFKKEYPNPILYKEIFGNSQEQNLGKVG